MTTNRKKVLDIIEAIKTEGKQVKIMGYVFQVYPLRRMPFFGRNMQKIIFTNDTVPFEEKN